jgi:hypothetical protein
MKNQAIVMALALAFSAGANAFQEVDATSNSNYDKKYFPASGCSAQNHASATVGRGGNIFNTSTTATNDLTCPVELDRFVSLDRFVTLVVVREVGAGAMTCYLNTNDGVANTITNKAVPLQSSTDQTLFFSRVNSDIYAANVGCTTPKKTAAGKQSGIRRYEFQEY